MYYWEMSVSTQMRPECNRGVCMCVWCVYKHAWSEHMARESMYLTAYDTKISSRR